MNYLRHRPAQAPKRLLWVTVVLIARGVCKGWKKMMIVLSWLSERIFFIECSGVYINNRGLDLNLYSFTHSTKNDDGCAIEFRTMYGCYMSVRIKDITWHNFSLRCMEMDMQYILSADMNFFMNQQNKKDIFFLFL